MVVVPITDINYLAFVFFTNFYVYKYLCLRVFQCTMRVPSTFSDKKMELELNLQLRVMM